MGGFLNQTLNSEFKHGLYSIIILAVRQSCELMVKDGIAQGKHIDNHEEKIRTHLLENYLDKDELRPQIGLANTPLRFTAEVPEGYDVTSESYIGRTDIKVVSSDWFANRNDYYIIECKRIDGTQTLNNKYVTEGVCRFVGDPPKYSSYHNRNFMLGFIVRNIDCAKNAKEIATIHRTVLNRKISKDITLNEETGVYHLYESEYVSSLVLSHIFYDFSAIVA